GQVRLGLRLARVHRARERGRRRGGGRHEPRDGPHGGALRLLRRAPRARLPGRAAPDRAALLHQLRRARAGRVLTTRVSPAAAGAASRAPGRAPAASCPQAAAMSRPRVRRTVAGSRARSRTVLKRAIASRDEPSYDPVGLYGIRLTLKRFGSSSAASARACSGRSLTPASSTYSTNTFRRRRAAYRSHSATTSPSG